MRAVVFALAFKTLLVGSANAGSDYEAVALAAYPTPPAIAVTVYLHDCGGRDSAGRVVCHSCGNEMTTEADGAIRAYADYNEQIIVDVSGTPRLTAMRELGLRHAATLTAEELTAERGNGPDADEKLLTNLFEDGNKWCAAFGGQRRDLKNTISDFARGKVVDTK